MKWVFLIFLLEAIRVQMSTDQVKFHITRDENADAGFMVAFIKIGSKERLFIGRVTPTGRARDAGMSAEHLGWQMVKINDEYIGRSPSVEAYRILQTTQSPNETFTLTLARVQCEEDLGDE